MEHVVAFPRPAGLLLLLFSLSDREFKVFGNEINVGGPPVAHFQTDGETPVSVRAFEFMQIDAMDEYSMARNRIAIDLHCRYVWI